MELSILSKEYWDGTFDLLFTYKGLEILLLIIFTSTITGYYFHRLIHTCKNPLSSIRSRYKYWSRNISQIRASRSAFRARIKNANFLIMAIISSLGFFIIMILYFEAFQYHQKLTKGIFVLLLSIIGFLIIYKKYANYQITKLNKKKTKYEAEKDLNIDVILRELTPNMKVNLRENVVVEFQTILDSQGIKLERLNKETAMYTYELKEKTELLKRLKEFQWCDYCIGKTKERLNDMLFKCPNECTKRLFEHSKKVMNKNNVEQSESILISEQKNEKNNTDSNYTN